MTRKNPDKKTSDFFGDHLEIKPNFMQRPKSLEEIMAETFSPASTTTVELPATVDSKTTEENLTTDTTTTGVQIATAELISTAAPTPSINLSALRTLGIPTRLEAEVSRLHSIMSEPWQPLREIPAVSNYWQAYTEAWHWLEDNVLPHLEKDFKLTLRRCYRNAFGSLTTEGRFFAGQTTLAREVGLSKRRIQDILETFHLLGWVCKIAHYNRGDRKGTDYEMHLPPQVLSFFQHTDNPTVD
jgi:hypothetical protein